MKISTVAVLALVASLFACALAAPGAEQVLNPLTASIVQQ